MIQKVVKSKHRDIHPRRSTTSVLVAIFNLT